MLPDWISLKKILDVKPLSYWFQKTDYSDTYISQANFEIFLKFIETQGISILEHTQEQINYD